MRYKPNPSGMRELAREAGMARASKEGAERIRAAASADDPSGGYAVEDRTVPGGWGNEPRAGAAVVETARGDGPARRSLVRAARGGAR